MEFKHVQLFSKKLLFTGVLAGGLLVSGCEDLLDELDDGDDVDEVEVEAALSADPTVADPGDEITLDATSSSVAGADDLSYRWELETPDGSDAEIGDPTADVTSFTADEEGAYGVTLEVSADDVYDSASEEIYVGFQGVEEISSDINDNTTFESDYLYIVTNTIDVNADLTIEPGARIEFQEGTEMDIESGGSIDADGTEADPILFTGTSQVEGWWNGLHFSESEDINNQLNYVIVEYAGRSEMHTSTQPANITIARSRRDARVSITNTISRYSEGVGMHMHGNGELRDFENNTFTDNQAPVRVTSNQIYYLDADSDYQGNEHDRIIVSGGDVGGDDQNWQNLNVPYEIDGEVSISGVDVTIDAGTELYFDQGSEFEVENGGGIMAEGTEDDQILFTATQETPGWWNGIYINDSDNVNNKLEYVIVEYGGRTDLHTSTQPANVTVARTRRDGFLNITNSTLRHSEGYGLFLHSNGEMPESGNNTFTGNNTPARTTASHLDVFDADSDYQGNENDGVAISGNSTGGGDPTWENLNVPYIMSGDTDITNGFVTVEAGTEFQFDQGAEFEVSDGGGISAEGEDGNEIVFTGTQDTKGWWNGIYISDSEHIDNTLSRVVVEYGGREEYHSSVGAANVTVARSRRNASITLTDSDISNSGDHGIYVHSGGDVNDDICDENDFSENDGENCTVN